MWEQVTTNTNAGPLSPIPEFDYHYNNAVAVDADEHSSATARLLAKLSNSDLAFEWSMLCQDCTDCWSQHGKFSMPSREKWIRKDPDLNIYYYITCYRYAICIIVGLVYYCITNKAPAPLIHGWSFFSLRTDPMNVIE